MMKNLIADRFHGVPLMLDRVRGLALLKKLGSAEFLPSPRADEDDDEDRITWQDIFAPREKMRIGSDGIAKISVTGMLGSKLEKVYEKLGLATNYETIQAEIAAAVEGGAKGILFSVDSPGGMVMGSYEAVEAIRGISIPKASHTSGQEASAAYLLGSSVGQVFSTASAMVGSIGVIITFYDYSKLAEGMGIEPVVIASGDLKGTGVMGTSLSDAQYEYLKEIVMEAFGVFAGSVRSDRGAVDDDSMRGQMFSANEGMKRNLVDAIASEAEVRGWLVEQAG